MMSSLKRGKYQHFRNKKFYRVLGIAKHEETLEDLVIYECLYENPVTKLWARPLKVFMQKVELKGKKVPRFTYIEE